MSSLLQKLRDHNWTVLAIVAYALFMDYFIYGLIVPLGPYLPAKTTTESQMGLMFAAYAAGVLLATPIFGYLGDRLGCRKPMIIGVVLSAIAVVLFCFGSHFYLGLLARVCQGAAAAATWTAGMALVAAKYVRDRVQMMGLAMVGSTAGSIVGPFLGGLLFNLGGFQLPFYVCLAMVAIDATMRVTLLPKDGAVGEESPDLKALLFDKSVLIAALAVAVAALGWGIIEPLLPTHLEADGVTPMHVGLLFTCATIAYGFAAPVVARAVDRFTIKRTICCGIVAMASFLPLLSLSSNILVAGMCLSLVSVSFAFVLNPTSAELGNAVDRKGMQCYAAVYAVYNIAYSLGMMGANAIASVVGPSFQMLHALLSVSVVLLVCIPLIAKFMDADSVAQQELASG
jgi:MFS family permease